VYEKKGERLSMECFECEYLIVDGEDIESRIYYCGSPFVKRMSIDPYNDGLSCINFKEKSRDKP
jgi:hypothetical protein